MLQPKSKFTPPSDAVVVESENSFVPPSDAVEVKKKEDTASTVPKGNTELVQKSGSLDIGEPKIKNERLESVSKKDIVTTSSPRRITSDANKLKKEGQSFQKLADRKLFDYRQSTKIPEEEKQAIKKELDAKKEKQGVLNGIQTGLKQGWNAFIDVIGAGGSEETKKNWKVDIDPFADEKKEAIDFFKTQGIKPTDSQIQQKTDEIFIKNKTLQLKQDKINDYLGSLDEQEKTYLEVDAQKRFPTISKKRQDILNRISMNEKALAKSIKDLKNPMTEQDAAMIESEISKTTKYLDEDKMLFSKASEELGTAKDEFEAFKRNYNMLENAKARTVASISEGAVSFIEGLDYLGTLGGNIGSKKQSEELFKDTEKARKGIQEYREQYRPDNKELTLDNFFEYSTDLLANQSGTLLTIAGAGSTGGASILGLGQAGQTYAEMRKANKNGTNYAPWQMVVAPAVSGISTRILSASPTFETLKNAKNVWKAAIKDPLAKEISQNAIKKTSQSIAKQVFGDTKKEVVTELLDNTIQNAVKKDILGDNSVGYFDNSWQVLKDTALMTGLLNAGALPQVTMEGVRMFSDYESGKKLNNNGQKIAQLLPQLDNENISEASRKAIELEVDKATSENTQIINSTLDKLANLPDSDVKKVVDNNKKQGELISEAEAIKGDNSIEIPAKKILLDAKKQEYENIQKSTNEIINAEVKIPTTKPEVKPEAEVQKPSEAEKVEQLRAEEQVELKEALPDAELNSEGKVDEEKLSKEDKIVFDKIYDKYDKLITPLLENEAQAQRDTPTDANIPTGNEPMEQVGIEEKPTAEIVAEENIQSANDVGTGKGEVKRVKSVKGIEYDVQFDENGKVVKINSIKDGREITKFFEKTNPITKKKTFAKNPNYTRIEADALGNATESELKTENKKILNKALDDFTPSNEYEAALEALARGAKVSVESLKKEIGNTDAKWATNKSSKIKLPSFETLAEEILAQYPGMDMQDIRSSLIDIVNSNSSINQVQENLIKSTEEKSNFLNEQELRTYLGSLSEKDLAMYEAVKAEDDYLSQLSDVEIEEYYNQKINEYENATRETTNEKPSDTAKSDEAKVREKQPTRQEKVAQRKKIAEAKIDDMVKAINEIDSIFGIKIKIDDVDGLNKNGIDIVAVIASIVKQAVNAGIEVDEAIKKTIEHLKKTIDFDVNIDDVKAKLKETEIPQDFERKQGKKSVLGRMASGNSSVIKKAIAKYSLDYEIEKQKEAKAKAEAFVDEVGVDNALDAVRKGLIDGAQGAFIYARAIEVLEQEINNLKDEDRLDAIADYQELLGEISDELDIRSRKNGQFIAALAEIYNSSNGRYNLTKMVNDYKAKNNGEISKEVLEKLKNVEEKLKEYETKLAELEAKKRIEEENEAFNNILESVARKKRINTNAKITDKQKTKAFADKLRSFKISNLGGANVVTPFSVAYDSAIEVAAQALELTGFVSDAIKAGVNSIRNANLSKDEQEQALSDLFDLFDDSDVNTGQRGMMSIDQDGKLRVPHSLIREKVENGIDNIDDLVAELMSDAKELFPDLDFTERQVRDIVTGYGKISNPTQDEIETQISIMKSLGKIASGLEDVKKGQRPLRSGQQRREPVLKERTEMKKLKALMRDLPLADADIKKAYKTASDAIKKRLSNEIEELDDQIAKGEKRKGQKSVIEYDQEIKDLKATRDAKKALLDEIVGKPELTEQQKIERTEKTLQKRLDDLQQKINSNEIDYAKKPEAVTSDKLEEMRKLKKEYEAQIQKMREDTGMAEARMIEIAKRSATKRLTALKERIASGDFERKKRKPTPTDAELNKIKSEIAEQKEIWDKEAYKLELKNRRIEVKALDLLKDILSIPKILSFTSDLSFIGIQNVTQIYKMGANSLIHLAKTGKLKGTFRSAMAKTFKAMASPDFEQKVMQEVKANPNYQLWKDSKLGIVESHYKESAKAEVFQHNAISMAFDILANYIASKGHERTANIIKDYVNIISIFERGQTVFENVMRINRFQEGVDLLKAQGLNPIDDIQEYRKVAAAVNTLTGRANTGSKVASALREMNGTLFSSFSNWAAGVNQLNPYWYYTLTPTARKMALTDVAHHIVGAGSMISMAALYALGQDEDDEDKVVVESSPTSSDFAIIRVGNLRIDPWAGKKTTVVAFSRLVNGGKTDKYGNFKEYGIEYEDEDWIDLPLEYAGNKIAPGPRFFLDRFFKTKEVEYKGTSFREDKFGVDFKKSKYLIPLIFENFREVNEEQPNLFGKATMALSWTGLINTNVYGGMKEGFKDMPDDFLEKEYKVKIQKIKDNEKILEFNADKLAKQYNEKEIKKSDIYKKVDSLVSGDGELFDKTMKMIIKKVNKEELKTLVTDPFYLGLKKEKNPEIQAILFYGKFKDDKGMSAEDKKERDKNLRYVEFESSPKFIKVYQELKKAKTPN